MAEKEEVSSLFHEKHHQEVWYLLAGLALISLVLQRLYVIFAYAINYATVGQVLTRWEHNLWHGWQYVAVILTGIGVVWGTFALRALRKIEAEEEALYGAPPEGLIEETFAHDNKKENKRWLHVLELSNSTNPADWRVAIIEADIMLDELLKTCGYTGEGIGEKLKSVEPSDMLTLDNAWEAHKVRNRIAHSGSSFELNERETQRVITLYESVFKEFEII